MSKSILIIDDEALVTKSLKKLLEKEGFAVTIAESGAEGISAAKEQDFDLVVSDIRMPNQDGIEVVRQIRQIAEEKGKEPAPEILITGYADEGKYKDAIDLKVAGYMYKPFDTGEFIEKIKGVI